MYIDSHCHLNFKEFDEDRAMAIGNAKKAGVKQFLIPGVDLYFSQKAVELAEQNPGVVFAGVGFHPYEASHNPDVNALETLLQNNISRLPAGEAGITYHVSPPTIVAIGECGLDYHRYKGQEADGRKDLQKQLFEEQLRLALKYDLPVIVHCREAFEDTFEILDNFPEPPRGVVHCFSGGLQEVRMLRERKFYLGLDGNITYSKQLQAIIPQIPLEMILLETDAPYLTPEPHRGRRNEPKYLPLIAKCIAQLQKVSVKKVEEATTKNTQTLFGL